MFRATFHIIEVREQLQIIKVFYVHFVVLISSGFLDPLRSRNIRRTLLASVHKTKRESEDKMNSNLSLRRRRHGIKFNGIVKDAI